MLQGYIVFRWFSREPTAFFDSFLSSPVDNDE